MKKENSFEKQDEAASEIKEVWGARKIQPA
jgi:hypothetical protein